MRNAPEDAYEIEVYSPQGKLERVIHRDYETRVRTEEEMEQLREQFGEGPGADALDLEIPTTDADVAGIDVRPNGEIWVRNSRSQEEHEGFGLIDVFDPEGRFLRQVMPQVPYDSAEDGYTIHGDRFYRIKEMNGALQAWAAGFGGGLKVVIGNPDSGDEDEGSLDTLEIQAYRLPEALTTAN